MNAYTFIDCDASRNPAEPFEWEELPSLSTGVLRRYVPSGSYSLAAELVAEARTRLRDRPTVGPVWLETAPADTVLDGLAAREIVEPDVFKHFFGAVPR
jgi:hypothetical protein